MAAASIEVETRGAVALITLNRPESSNTLNLQMAMDLLAAAMTCARNATVRAVVLTGAGRHFCFGGDLRGMAAHAGAGSDYVRELTTYLHAAMSSPPICTRRFRTSCAWTRRSSPRSTEQPRE